MTTEKHPVIIYGAGDNGKSALALLRGRGIEPYAFCSRNTAKAGKTYCGLPIMSRDQILKQFGTQFKIWITPYSPVREEIEAELLEIGFVDRDRILNSILDDKAEESFGCARLYSELIVTDNLLRICCFDHVIGLPNVTLDPNAGVEHYRAVIREFNRKRAELTEGFRAGRQNACIGCPYATKARWGAFSGKINSLAVNSFSPCQFSCSYCRWESNAKYRNREVIERALSIDFIAIIDALELEGVLELGYPIFVAFGEITIYPRKREILDRLSKYPLAIYTNGAIYDEQIAKLVARDDGSYLNISVDAGTAETYKKVKGMDVFDKVLTNIRAYKAKGGRMYLKYILLPENSGKNDLDSFLSFCADINVDKIQISRDEYVSLESLPQEVLDATDYMIEQANKLCLPYEFDVPVTEKNPLEISL